LGFISLSFAVFKKPTLSLLFFILYVNLKFQGIISLPIIFLTLFDQLRHYGFK
jgi:hypothetical protein